MKNEVKLKEAIKVALAFALVYGIALRINWMLPSWAGWSVVAVAASSSGQSIEKGAMRLLGTLLACLSAVIIIALSPQDRWPFVILTTVWLFFTSYMMLADKSRSYFWFCVSYVCLVILSVGSSSVGAFAIAMYRTLETALGIIVYTLIAVFVWPKSNIGMIKKTSIAVVQSQMDLFQYAYQEMMGTIDKTNLFQLREVEMKQLTALNQALKDEASENYEIAEVRGLWDEFLMRNQHLQKTKNRLFAAIDDLKHLEIKPNISNLEPFFQEINARFSEVSGILAGSKPAFKIQNINFGYDNQDININKFSHLDKSALAILLSELKKVEEESRCVLELIYEINGFPLEHSIAFEKSKPLETNSFYKIIAPELENLKGALYVSLVVFFGFVIWFYLDPPGHNMWFVMSGVLALVFVPFFPLRMTKLITPFILFMVLFGLIYVFLLPQLSNFYQLGLLLFLCAFVVQYFMSGIASTICTIVMIQMIAITNPQEFNISGLISCFVYIPGIFMFLFLTSYIISAPRPEKGFLQLIHRFFKSADYLISTQVVVESNKRVGFIAKFKETYHRKEIESLPDRVNNWGKAINLDLFPNANAEAISELVAIMRILVIRMEELIDLRNRSTADEAVKAIQDVVVEWKLGLQLSLQSLNFLDEEYSDRIYEAELSRIASLEAEVEQFVLKHKDSLNEEQGVHFYRLLGYFRGVTEALLEFSKTANKINWLEFKEERFQ